MGGLFQVGGAVVGGLQKRDWDSARRHLWVEDYYRNEARRERMSIIQKAQERHSFEMAMVKLRELENEAKQRMLLHNAMVATFLAEA